VAIRIAIPMPHSVDREYGERAIPQYERAVALVGGEPVRIPLDRTSAELRRLIENCDSVLLPGSNADIDPGRFHQQKLQHTAAADPRREEVDDLLLEDAYAQRKPVLGICYGLQSLNVFRKGSLVQHIPDFLPEATRALVNHEAGRTVAVAHPVEIEGDSVLADVVRRGKWDARSAVLRGVEGCEPADSGAAEDNRLIVPVNSSHHQSADTIGADLRIVARCPDDGIIEALEGTSPDQFVLAVQWHPERSVDDDECSRNIFRSLIDAAKRNGA
jgi:putative glutamine amidotransferase